MPSKNPSKKKTAVKKTAKKKTAAKKAPATKKKAAAKGAKKAATKTATKKVAKEAAVDSSANSKKGKLIEMIKRPSHTPAIFKPTSRRAIHVAFTMEDVREVLKKRAAEEKLEEATQKKAKLAEAAAAKALEKVRIDETVTQQKSRHHAASLDDILGLSAGTAGPVPNAGNVPKKFQKYHDLLIELRDQVREELNLHSNDTLKRSQKEDAGDIAISVDAGTDNFDRDFALSLLSSEQEALNEIEEAIQRIYKGTYGKCEVTGEPIKAERLEAVPFTRFSVEGQKEYEQNTRKRVSRAGAFLNEASGEKISFGDDDGDN
jgi:RNA polymerase-binding transcription factor DksA